MNRTRQREIERFRQTASLYAECGYVSLVPFVEDDKLVALKTNIPSRKATKQSLEKEPDDHEA